MNQQKKINDLIETGRQRKKKRLDLQRKNYKYHTDLAKNIVESFTTTANHFTVEEENDEFKWNDSISTLYNNTNGTGSSIITNYDPYLHCEYLQDVNNNAFFTSKAIVQEQELTSSNSSNYLNGDNSKTFESFTIQTEGIIGSIKASIDLI
ncbi:unnamed protein product [Rotaria sp. Silwood1]|nr:unnamed protein product [Rotaria sp. Silwood1]CAF1651058.1 unnamed protein product [Rotaria sp. Silwood1]